MDGVAREPKQVRHVGRDHQHYSRHVVRTPVPQRRHPDAWDPRELLVPGRQRRVATLSSAQRQDPADQVGGGDAATIGVGAVANPQGAQGVLVCTPR